MATIKDIAKECGVSIATVSNALNGTGRIADDTKNLIMSAANRLGYVPNVMARNLKQKQTKIIGVITEDLTVFHTAEIVDGIHEYLDEHNYSFLVGNLRLFKKYDNAFYKENMYQSAAMDEFRVMLSKNVDGIIYVGAHCREIHVIPEDCSVPVVMAYGFDKDRRVPSVIYDDNEAAYDAVEYLLDSGVDKIGVIAGDKGSLHTFSRKQGYERALVERNIQPDEKLVCYGNWEREGGYKACSKLIKAGVDAIFSMSDTMSVGVYDYAVHKGIQIGKDISLISFDNREISAELSPALTTLAPPIHQIGAEAAKICIRMIEDDDYTPERVTKLKCDLIERASVR